MCLVKFFESILQKIRRIFFNVFPRMHLPRNVATEFEVEQAIQLLAYAFSQPDEIFVRVALYAVLTAKTPSVILFNRALSHFIPPELDKAFEWIGRYGQIDLIVPMLQHEDSQVRYAAAYALREMGNTRHLPMLMTAMSDSYIRVKNRATVAVNKIRKNGHFGDQRFLTLEPISETERTISKLILKQTTELDIPLMFRFLEHPKWPIRRMARDALAKIGKPAAEYVFAALAHTEEAYSNISGASREAV